jgi:hypothetical protein
LEKEAASTVKQEKGEGAMKRPGGLVEAAEVATHPVKNHTAGVHWDLLGVGRVHFAGLFDASQETTKNRFKINLEETEPFRVCMQPTGP